MAGTQRQSNTEECNNAPAQPHHPSIRNWYITALNLLFAACLPVIFILDVARQVNLDELIYSLTNHFNEFAQAVCKAYMPGAVLLAVLLTHTFAMPSRKLCYFTAGPFVASALAAAVYIAVKFAIFIKFKAYICFMIWNALTFLWTGFTLVVSYTLPPWAPLVLGRVAAAPEAQADTTGDPSSSKV